MRRRLFQKRRDIRLEVQPAVLERWHLAYLKRFAKRHRGLLYLLLVTLGLQVLLEICLPAYSHFMIREVNALLDFQVASLHLSALTLGFMFYLGAAFVYLWIEKSIVVILLNELREHWYRVALYLPQQSLASRDRAKLIAKFTYHFSLVQMGLAASVGGALRWSLNTIALAALTFLISPSLLLIVLASVPISLGLAAVGYAIGRSYLSREAALSTAIITNISENLDQATLLQRQAREEKAIAELSSLVELDSAFKVRRYLWLEFGYRIIFTLLTLGAAGISILLLLNPSFQINSLYTGSSLTAGIVLAYLARQLYLSLHVGLYLVPTKIGLILSLPDPEVAALRQDRLGDFTSISFSSRKVKLIPYTEYLHNVSLSFECGKRYLIYGHNRVGKSRLAALLAGEATQKGKPWIVRMDGRRYRYGAWRRWSRRCYLATGSSSGATIGELLTGLPRIELTEQHINELTSVIEKTPALHFLNDLPKFTATPVDKAPFTPAELALCNLASCLIRQTRLIVIDNVVMDLPDERIKNLISVLNERLTGSSIVCFAHNPVNWIPFTTTYELTSANLTAR